MTDFNLMLDTVVRATRVTRYRSLCDPSNPAYNAGYIPVIEKMYTEIIEGKSSVKVKPIEKPKWKILPPFEFPPIRKFTPGGKVKVAIAGPCCVVGGAERHTLSLLHATDHSQIDWRAVTFQPEHTDSSMTNAIESICPFTSGMEAAIKAAKEVDVFLFWGEDVWLSFMEGLESRPRIVSICHSPMCQWAETLYQHGGSGIDRFVAVSPLALEPIPRIQDATMIPNCVDPSRLTAKRSRGEVRRSWGVREDARVALFLRRMTWEKDPDAALRLAEADPSLEVVFVGGGCEADRLKKDVEIRGLKNVHLVGETQDVGDCFNAADVFMVTSKFESFCLSMAEALWFGLPVISTSVGIAQFARSKDLVRTIRFDATGDMLAAAVKADLDDIEGTRERVARAGEYARKEFSPSVFGKRWTDFLVSLVAPPVVKVSGGCGSCGGKKLTKAELAKREAIRKRLNG